MGVFFQDGGAVMYPTLVFGFFLAASAVQGLLRRERRPLTAWLAALTATSGALGTAMGLINTMRYVARTSEWAVAPVGVAESLNNVVLACVLVSIACLIVCAAELRGAKAAHG